MTNYKMVLAILLNIFVLVTLISMVLTGNNWNDPEVHVLCASSIGLNVLFAEYVVIGKR